MEPIIEEFSAGYYLLHADVIEGNVNSVTTDEAFYLGLESLVGVPEIWLAGVSDHKRVDYQASVPAETLVIPSDIDADTDNPVFLKKHAAKEAMQ